MIATAILGILCGFVSGFALGLVGGGGSILGTPLLLYVVGVGPPHKAIGTSAVAVAVAALFNFATHAGAGNVRWRSAVVFATTGAAGALIGSSLGKAFEGQKLLFVFGLLMIFVGIKMLRRRDDGEDPKPHYETRSDLLVAGLALFAGMASGFFGVGGGFLIVPCLLFATRMPMIDAVGSSLLAVAAFSIATAVNYARSGFVDWQAAGWFVLGGIAGGGAGMLCAVKLCARKGLLRKIFGVLILIVAAYVIASSFDRILRSLT